MRALRRHHTKRLAAKRRPLHWRPDAVSDNELATRHPLDCGSRCLLCHHDKFLEPRRSREKRQWRREVTS